MIKIDAPIQLDDLKAETFTVDLFRGIEREFAKPGNSPYKLELTTDVVVKFPYLMRKWLDLAFDPETPFLYAAATRRQWHFYLNGSPKVRKKWKSALRHKAKMATKEKTTSRK